jgi:selenocysteine lyase/cysteine desulfurase
MGIVALAESLGLLEELGVDAAMAHARSVLDHLLDGLQRLPVTITSDLRPAHRSQIVAFTTGEEAGDAALVRRLEEANVTVGLRPFGVRLSVHFWNTAADADRLLDVVAG